MIYKTAKSLHRAWYMWRYNKTASQADYMWSLKGAVIRDHWKTQVFLDPMGKQWNYFKPIEPKALFKPIKYKTINNPRLDV